MHRAASIVLAITVGICVGFDLLTFLPRQESVDDAIAVRDGSTVNSVVVTVRTLRSPGGTPRYTEWTVDDAATDPSTDDIASPLPAGTAEPLGSPADCAGEDCYRVRPGALAVEASHDGGRTYATDWEISGEAYTRLAAAYPDLGDPAVDLTSRSVIVHATAGGHVVFVANGRDGLLYRSADGTWHRLGMPAGGEGFYFRPAPRLSTEPAPVDASLIVGIVVAVGLLLVGIGTALARRVRQVGRIAAVVGVAGLAGVVSAVAARTPDVGMLAGWVYGGPTILAVLGGAGYLVIRLVGGRAPVVAGDPPYPAIPSR